MGQNSTLILKGAILGDAALIGNAGGTLIGNAGGALIGNAGGALTHDAKTAKLIGQDGSGLIGQDGSGLISQDGGGLISQDGSGLISQDGSGLTHGISSNPRKKSGAFRSLGNPVQPTFTGQMTIDGNYSQFPGTTLMIGIAGASTLSDGAQQFDQLVVSGQANLLGGTIAFELFNPDNQTNRASVFQPADGATFDVVVASNIVANAVHLRGPVWGDGLFFKGGLVTRPDGLQAVRLVATHIEPQVFVQSEGSMLRVVYGTNYSGYTLQASASLSSSNWTAFTTGTNAVTLSPTNSSGFFRLSKP